ncbi:sugar phosphate isomerase/epimerase family protein [Geodermatophilus sp. SYSU D01119]
MVVLGTTLFSLTPDWRAGADLSGLLERVAAAGCGPAVEVVGAQAWRGFPAVDPAEEQAFRAAVDRLGLLPVALGVYTDLFRRPGRRLDDDEVLAELRPQMETAARLGFGAVRATLGMGAPLLRRAAAEAERVGVALTFEVQGAIPPDAPAVLEVAQLQQETGTPYLGLTLDTSLTTPALPAALGTALRRLGLTGAGVAAVAAAWAQDGPVGPRIGAALAALGDAPRRDELSVLVAGVLGRCGRSAPADWAHLLPLVRHAHAKCWDPDVEAVRAPTAAWVAALEAAGYTGALLSEWGGHELLLRSDADALTVTAAHVALLRGLTAARTAVPA